MSNKKKLLVCLTPFQLFLAEKIIRKEDDWILVFITHGNNRKNDYYYEEIQSKIKKSFRYNVSNHNILLKFLIYIFFLIRVLFSIGFVKEVMVSTINDKHVYILLKFFSVNDIVSFDDGVGNIYLDGVYHDSNNKVVNYIKDRIVKHYTIYSGMKNIVEDQKLEEIIFLQEEGLHSDGISSETISIFVGQPYDEFLDGVGNADKISKLMKELCIDFYYPHPREKELIDSVKYINTELIFEDYILKILHDNPELNIKIYTFFSSAVLNVSGFYRLTTFSVRDKYLQGKYRALYDIFDKNDIIKVEVEI